MATEVTTRCTCDWCSCVIKVVSGDHSNQRSLAPGVVSLDCVIQHHRWFHDDLCDVCLAALQDLKRTRSTFLVQEKRDG